MTYRQLFDKFIEKYPSFLPQLNDWRSYGYNSIIVWLNDGSSYIVEYWDSKDDFNIKLYKPKENIVRCANEQTLIEIDVTNKLIFCPQCHRKDIIIIAFNEDCGANTLDCECVYCHNRFEKPLHDAHLIKYVRKNKYYLERVLENIEEFSENYQDITISFANADHEDIWVSGLGCDYFCSFNKDLGLYLRDELTKLGLSVELTYSPKLHSGKLYDFKLYIRW